MLDDEVEFNIKDFEPSDEEVLSMIHKYHKAKLDKTRKTRSYKFKRQVETGEVRLIAEQFYAPPSTAQHMSNLERTRKRKEAEKIKGNPNSRKRRKIFAGESKRDQQEDLTLKKSYVGKLFNRTLSLRKGK